MRTTICLDCGKNRPHYARGLCAPCYKHWRYQERRDEVRAYNESYYQEHREEIIASSSRWQRENPAKVAVKNRRWKRGNRETVAAQSARRRARKKNLPNTLTGEQAEKKLSLLPCFYCGAEMELELDHFVGLASQGNVACGTTLANSVVACRSCNAQKWCKMPNEILIQLSLVTT